MASTTAAAVETFTGAVYDAMQTAGLDPEGAIAALLTLACCVNSEREEPLMPVALGALLMGTASRQQHLHLRARRAPFAEA